MAQRDERSFPSSAILMAAALYALALGGCNAKSCLSGSLAGCPNLKILVSIQITPANPSVPMGFTEQLKATGQFSDGTSSDITNSMNWTSSDTNIAVVNSSGLVTTEALGRPKVTATDPSTMLSSSTNIIIVGNPSAATPRFAYATNLDDNTISIYSVNASTGQLRANGYVHTASGHPNSICLDPAGKFAYVTNNSTNDVSAFLVNPSNGSLTPVAGS